MSENTQAPQPDPRMQDLITKLARIPVGLSVEYVIAGKAERGPHTLWRLLGRLLDARRAAEDPEAEIPVQINVPTVDQDHPKFTLDSTGKELYEVLQHIMYTAHEHFGSVVSQMTGPGITQAGMLGMVVLAAYDPNAEPNGDGVMVHAQTAPKPVLVDYGHDVMLKLLDRMKEVEEQLRGQLEEIYGPAIKSAPDLIIVGKK